MTDDIIQRLERLEAIEAIKQLPSRYAQCVDQRNIDGLIALFSPDSEVHGGGNGPEQRRASFIRSQSQFPTTVHFVGNHVIDMDPVNPERATGSVYRRAEHESGDLWIVAMMYYDDEYVRSQGKWVFNHRYRPGDGTHRLRRRRQRSARRR